MRIPTIEELAPTVAELRPTYEWYVEHVSHPDHAISLETAALLLWTCRHVGATRVCDLGSGYSSYVLRHYASAAPLEAVSVETDPVWMNRTLEFLGTDDGRLLSWEDWVAGEDTYDVIFHDIANGEFREAAMWNAADRLAPGGVLVLDDAQHAGHRRRMAEVAHENRMSLVSARGVTLDRINRFAMVAWDEEPALLDEFDRLCRTPSDIVGHLPTFATMTRDLHAQHVIELGTRTGVSTIAWLYALGQTGGRLTSIDIDERPGIGEHEHWTFIQGDDLDPDIVGSLEPAEIVFIDTSHEHVQTLRELHTYRWLVKPGGLMVLHDTELPSVGVPTDPPYPVRTAIERFTSETGFEWANMPGSWGLGVIQL